MNAIERKDIFNALVSIPPLTCMMIWDVEQVQKVTDDGEFKNNPSTWPALFEELAKKYDVPYVRPDVAARSHLTSVTTIH